MRFPFNRRPAPAPHPDDWVTRIFARFMAEDETAPDGTVEPTRCDDGAAVEGLGARLREERNRLGRTQVQLAKLGGASRSSQKLYESGKSPNAAYLAAISAADVDILYVVTGRREGGAK